MSGSLKKIAVFFPGIGYTVDRPLLYYSRRLCEQAGYEIKLLSFSGFPSNVKGDSEKMKESLTLAIEQSQKELLGLDFSGCSDVLFISKSIGTVASAAMEEKNPDVPIRQILFTPLKETFEYRIKSGIAFTGEMDPWTGLLNSPVKDLCLKEGIPCSVIPFANHSLETGDALKDIDVIKGVLDAVKDYLL